MRSFVVDLRLEGKSDVLLLSMQRVWVDGEHASIAVPRFSHSTVRTVRTVFKSTSRIGEISSGNKKKRVALWGLPFVAVVAVDPLTDRIDRIPTV